MECFALRRLMEECWVGEARGRPSAAAVEARLLVQRGDDPCISQPAVPLEAWVDSADRSNQTAKLGVLSLLTELDAADVADETLL
jgi:hypothetical protein